MKPHEYMWWVGLWQDSDGDVTLEVESKPIIDYFTHVIGNGELLLINDYQKHPQGYFSTLIKK